ncbi:hypothetical protein LR48_Vigan05g023900 [Vigna angularis]|uniref:Uncharacterized protein n=1 Tax=Phaseolus angularis TaxID=3914 RepID=A0A0L9UIB4_PHAAN|nr:hypothetical protein LR48_Vigan05g023900 [Vigna angularis]
MLTQKQTSRVERLTGDRTWICSVQIEAHGAGNVPTVLNVERRRDGFEEEGECMQRMGRSVSEKFSSLPQVNRTFSHTRTPVDTRRPSTIGPLTRGMIKKLQDEYSPKGQTLFAIFGWKIGDLEDACTCLPLLFSECFNVTHGRRAAENVSAF